MRIYFEIYKNFKLSKYNNKILFLIIFSFVSLILELFSIGLLIPIIGVLFESNILNEYYLFKKIILLINPLKLIDNFSEQQNLLGGLCSLYFLLIFLKNLLLFFMMKYMSKIIFDIGLETKTNFLSKIIDMPFLLSNKHKLSGLLTYNNNIETIKESLSIILSCIIETILIFGILIFLLIKSPQAMLMIIIIVLILMIFNKSYLNKKLSFFSSQIKINEKEQVNFLLATLKGIKNIKLDDTKNFFLNKFKFHLGKSNEANFGFTILTGSMRLITEIMSAALISLLIIYFVLNDLDVSEIVITLAIFLAGAIKILPSLNRITVSFQTLRYAKDRLIDLNSFYVNNLKDLFDLRSIKFENELELKNFSHIYDESNKVFENTNFKISKGEKIYVKGESGIGKSTLVNIISGLIPCEAGSLLINNKDITSQFRISNLGYITQRPFFISETIINNVCLGIDKEKQNLDRVKECLKDARIYDDIMKLQNQLNSQIINEGEGFSGGQLQRISLARLLYKNYDFLILDEFSNALDESNEKIILDTLFKKYKEKTIILISHKEYENLNFDKKYKIEAKKIIKF